LTTANQSAFSTDPLADTGVTKHKCNTHKNLNKDTRKTTDLQIKANETAWFKPHGPFKAIVQQTVRTTIPCEPHH